jgi:hypothetical protein
VIGGPSSAFDEEEFKEIIDKSIEEEEDMIFSKLKH